MRAGSSSSKGRDRSWVTRWGQETFASLAPDQTPPWEARQAGGSGWPGASIQALIHFFLPPEQSRILFLLPKGTDCAGAWRGAACVKQCWKHPGRLCRHCRRCFMHHHEPCYWFFSTLVIKLSWGSVLLKAALERHKDQHLHVLFWKLTRLARPNAVGRGIIFLCDCWTSFLLCQALPVLREKGYCAKSHPKWVQFYKSMLMLSLLEPGANKRSLNEQYCVFNYVWGTIQTAQELCVGCTVRKFSNEAVYWGTLAFL